MSNNQSKSVLQRAVGGIFLLGLIGLIAVLLLQPSDKLPNPTTKDDNPQKPRISITADSQKSGAERDKSNDLVLESTSSAGKLPAQLGNKEIIGEDIWQSVEQSNSHNTASTHSNPTLTNTAPITGEKIVAANPDKLVTPKVEAPRTNPNQTQKSAEKPKTATNGKSEAPKIQLISDAQTSTKAATPKTTSPSTSSGKWYVQLGAFSNTANAQKLMNEFKQKGYNVRIQKDNQLNRVQIGPFATKKEAEQVQSRTKGGSLNPSVFQAK